MFKTHLPRHIHSRVFTDSWHCSRHDCFLSRQVLFNLYDDNVFVPSQPPYQFQWGAYQCWHSFWFGVSIPGDGEVPNWPVSVQYFSHMEMAMLFLFDCHWLVVGAPRRNFPDRIYKHLPWLLLTLHVRIPCAPTAMFMHHLSLEHSPFLKCGALPKDRDKGRCPNHKALGRAENSTHHTSTRNIERLIEGWRPYSEWTSCKLHVFFLCSLEWWKHWRLQTLSLAWITCHKTYSMFCLWFYNYLLLHFSLYFLFAPRVEHCL